MKTKADKKGAYQCIRCSAIYADSVSFCWTCGASGLVLPRSWRPSEVRMARHSQPVTARELATRKHVTFSVARYPELRLGPGCLLTLQGPPAAHKSTMATLVADSLRPALYLPLEEKVGAVLAGRLQRLECYAQDMIFDTPRTVGELVDLVEEHRPRCLVIDSVQMAALVPDDALELARGMNGVVIAVCQENKSKQAAGSAQWLYLCDVLIRVLDGQWTIEKSRFQLSGVTGSVL